MAVPLATVKAENEKLSQLKPGLVGVFVGGTAGIGEFTLKAFARRTRSPKIYIVGRNENEAKRIQDEAMTLNPSCETFFVKTADGSLLKNVDAACKEIQTKEPAVNLLFLTTGYLTLDGRQETSEGIDRKLSLNYYSRMRFAQQLQPQLDAGAAQADGLSRVVSVLAAGEEAKVHEDDLDLKRNFSMMNCARHSVILNDFAAEELAKAHPRTAFVHTFPNYVQTGVMDHGGAILRAAGMLGKLLGRFFAVGPDECGERNLFHATAARYAPKEAAGDDAAVGSDGTTGSGAYWLGWDGRSVGIEKVTGPLRAKGFGKTAWDHTQEIFRQAEKTWAAAKADE